MKTINATEFKAKCLALLDEVAETGEPLRILKTGRPVAELVPPVAAHEGLPQDAIKDTVEIIGDIVEPALPAVVWDMFGANSDDDR